MALLNGTALQQRCDQEHLDLENKLVAFGSDGAAVMIGARGGVATLAAKVPMVDFKLLCSPSPCPCCSPGSRRGSLCQKV